MNVILHGATGFTGALVARALLARGIAPILAGRNAAKLAALATTLAGDDATADAGRSLETRTVDLSHIEALYEALSDADVIVNCAGPFVRFGEPVVRAALRAGAHYLDTTGEQAFMRDTYERYESAARRAGVCMINAFAFEVALGDFCAALAADTLGAGPSAPLDALSIGYAINDMAPTRGTALSAIEAMAGTGVVWQHARWDPCAAGADTRAFAFPPPFGDRTAVSFPSGEVITVPRHVNAHRVQTYLALDGAAGAIAARLSPLVGPALGAVMRSPLRKLIAKTVDASAEAPTDGQRAVMDFCVTAVAQRGTDRAWVAASGTDVYGVTAHIIALGVALLLEGEHRGAGVLAPSEAFDPAACLDALNMTVTRSQ